MANPRKLLPDEIRRLPVKNVRYNNGQSVTLFYDAESGVGYIDQGNGEFKRVRLSGGDAGAKPAAETKPPDEGKPKAEEKTEKKKKREKKNKAPKKKDDGDSEGKGPLTSKQIGIIIVAAAVLVALLYALFSSGILSSGDSPGSTPEEETKPLSVEDLAAAEKYEVLVVTKNMFRGDKIEKDDLTTCVISKAEYAACGGAYTKACLSAVTGMEITKFMPFGTILTYDACDLPTKYAVSPWIELREGQDYLDVPVKIEVADINNLIYGDNIKLTIKIETTYKEQSDADKSDIDGMGHSSSVSASTTTDIYEFNSIQIADLLNANGKSIYKKYSGYYCVPVGFIGAVIRDDYNADNISNLLPAYLRVVVTTEQKAAIGDLSKGTVTVTTKFLSHAEENTFPVSNFLSMNEYIGNAIIQRYNEIQKEQKEANKNG